MITFLKIPKCGEPTRLASQIAKFMEPTWGPPLEFCGPQIGPMLAPWTLLSGMSIDSISACGRACGNDIMLKYDPYALLTGNHALRLINACEYHHKRP